MPQEIISQFERNFNSPIETARQVNTIGQRDAISSLIRWQGMLVYVVSEGLTYSLIGGIDNTSWQPFTGLLDAPSDGEEYVRKNGAWAIATTGAGITQSSGSLSCSYTSTGAIVNTGGGGYGSLTIFYIITGNRIDYSFDALIPFNALSTNTIYPVTFTIDISGITGSSTGTYQGNLKSNIGSFGVGSNGNNYMNVNQMEVFSDEILIDISLSTRNSVSASNYTFSGNGFYLTS